MLLEHAEPLVRRLRAIHNLSEMDEQAVLRLPITVRRIDSGQTVLTTGDRPSVCCLIIDGFLLRSKIAVEGSRQVLSFHQPGDIPDLQSLFLDALDHEIIALGDCVLGFIPHDAIRALIRSSQKIAEAFWRDTLIDAAIFREWICNVGQRSALSRLAHLILEIHTRLTTIERTKGLSFQFPATQTIFAEAIGTSAVHANRIIQELRQKGLLAIERGSVTILDEKGLRQLADFNPLYLHLQPTL